MDAGVVHFIAGRSVELLSRNARKACARNIIGYRARSSIRRYILVATVQLFSTTTCQSGRARLQVLCELSHWRVSEKRSALVEGMTCTSVIFSFLAPYAVDNRRYRADANSSRRHDVYLYINLTTITLFSLSSCDTRLGQSFINDRLLVHFFFFALHVKSVRILFHDTKKLNWNSLSLFSGYVKV